MNLSDLKSKFPNASPSFLKRNCTQNWTSPDGDNYQTYVYENKNVIMPCGHIDCSPVTCRYENKTGSAVQNTLPECTIRTDPLGPSQGKAPSAARFRIRIVSYRQLLLDPDNLCPKYIVDCIKYSGIIPDDSPDHITLTVEQVKCKKAEERTEIEIDDTLAKT